MAISLKVIFDLDNSKLKIEDKTDYSSGYTTAVHGVIVAVGPGGTVHAGGTNTSPDLTVPSADFTLATPTQTSRKWDIALPSSLGGNWTITYYIYDNSGASSTATDSKVHEFTYIPPGSVNLSIAAVPSSSQVTSTDGTDYTFGSFTTVSNTRTHQLFPPPGALDFQGDPIPWPADSGSSAILTYTGITTGNWTSTVSSILELLYGTGAGAYYILTTITGGASINIDSDLGLCDVYCCLQALNSRYEEAKCKNKELAEDYKVKIEDVTRLVTLFVQAVNCGLTSDAETYLAEIKNISECGTDCSCYGDNSIPANIPIVSSTSSKSYQVVSNSSRLSVSSSGTGTSADPVVYSLDLGSSISGDIDYTAANLQTAISTTSAVSSQLDNLSSTLDNQGSSPQRHTFLLSQVIVGGGSPSFSASASTEFITGTRFIPASNITITSDNYGESNWLFMNNATRVTNIHNLLPASTDFTVTGYFTEEQDKTIVITNTSNDNNGSFVFKVQSTENFSGVQDVSNNKLVGTSKIRFNIISS
tara:strand:- start:3284 stop:4879 length:1596 start_codon:yes stop_codon:yes gene_type:complete